MATGFGEWAYLRKIMHQEQKMAPRHHENVGGLGKQQVGQRLAPMLAQIGTSFAGNQHRFHCGRQAGSGGQSCRTHHIAPLGQLRYRTALSKSQLAFAERFRQGASASVAGANEQDRKNAGAGLNRAGIRFHPMCSFQPRSLDSPAVATSCEGTLPVEEDSDKPGAASSSSSTSCHSAADKSLRSLRAFFYGACFAQRPESSGSSRAPS